MYLVTCLENGKQYVGFTSKTVAHRWAKHVEGASTHKFALARAIRKYGPKAFEVRTLATGMSREFALALESAAIRGLGTLSPGGYNLVTEGAPVPEDKPDTQPRDRRGGREHTEMGKRRAATMSGQNDALIKEAFDLSAAGLPIRVISEMLGIGRQVVGKWLSGDHRSVARARKRLQF